MSGLTNTEPEVAPPVEKFVPVQDVVFAEDHATDPAPPAPIEDGAAVRLAVGVGAGVTVTVALPVFVPPEPVQERLYAVVTEGDTVTEPEIAPPVVNPVPVQEVALDDDQVSVELLPFTIEVGDAESATVGGRPLSVTVSVTVFIPAEEKDFAAVAAEPNIVPASLHEYA